MVADDERHTGFDPLVETREQLWNRILSYRQTPFIVLAIIAALSAAGIVAAHFIEALDVWESVVARLGFASALSVALTAVALLLRDTEDNFAHGPKAGLPTMALVSLILVTSVTVTVPTDKRIATALNELLGPGEGMTLAYLGLFTCLTPLCWNAFNLSRFKKAARQQSRSTTVDESTAVDADREDAEAMGALIATLVVASLSLLATAAARWGNTLELQALYGVGLSAFVVGIFGVVIFLEPLSQLGFTRSLSRGFKWIARHSHFLAKFYGAIDEFLVHIAATSVGMEHRTMIGRYLVLSVLLACLSILAWYLPSPHGLVPGLIALIIALSVSRLWSWVEDDRALAALTDFNKDAPYRTEMREDFRDETLLGFMFVFALMPILMYQLHSAPVFAPYGVFDVPAGQEHSFLDWLGFFGIELAKAVPIVDWAEIYNIGSQEESNLISMNGALSQHAVFLARVTVDLVLIAALLQAIAISNRNRQQKRLYNAGADPAHRYKPGLIDRLDPFVERTELRQAIAQVTLPGAPIPDNNTDGHYARKKIFNLSDLKRPDLIDFRRYNPDRLLELHGETSDPSLRAFIAAIAAERPKFSLKSRIQLLEEMAEQGRKEKLLYAIQSKLSEDFEERPNKTEVSVASLYNVLFSTRNREGLKEFKLDTITLLGKVALAGSMEDIENALDFLARVAGLTDPDDFEYTKAAAVVRIADIAIDFRDERLLRVAQNNLIELRRAKPRATTARAIRVALDRVDRALEDILLPIET